MTRHAQDAGDAVDVVGVRVGEHEQGNRVDAEVAQAPVVGPRIGPGVDDDRLRPARRAARREAVALPDVAGHEQPAARRPPRRDELQRDDDKHGAPRALPAASLRTDGRRSGEHARGERHQQRGGRRRVITLPAIRPRCTAARAQNRATPVIQPTANPAGSTTSRAAVMDNGATAAAVTPSSVAGPTAGAASRLAGIATRLTPVPSMASSGAQATWAAAATASGSAR